MVNSFKLVHGILILIMYFTVLQFNIRGLSGKSSELYNYIESLEEYPEIICLQRNRLSNRGGGCAVYIHNPVNYKILEISSDIECIKIHVYYQDFECTIINFYNPGKAIHEDLNKILPPSPYKNTLILGDFNAHNPIWGSKLKTQSAEIWRAL